MKLKKLIAGVSALALALTTLGVSAYAEGATLSKDDSGAYVINNITELETFRDEANKGYYDGENSATGHTQVKLKADIDLSNVEWTPVVIKCLDFDGGNHTISNFKVCTQGQYAGFFDVSSISSIKNLTIDGATIESTHYAAAIAGHGLCAHFTNCHVKNSTIKTSVLDGDNGDKAGAICGYLSGEPTAEVTDCSAENVKVYGYRDCGILVGMANKTATVTNNTVKNSTVYADYSNENYNKYTLFSKRNFKTVAGRIESTATVENNTVQNVQVIKLVSAEDQLQDAINDADTDAVIQFKNNIDVSTNIVTVPDTKDVTIDLNDKILSATGLEEPLIVENGAKLTIGGGTVNGGNMLAIKLTKKESYEASKTATLVVNSGTYSAPDYAISGNGTRDNTSVTINGGTFIATREPTLNSSGAYDFGSAIYQPNKGSLTINGGTFTSYGAPVEVRNGDVTINGGTFTSTANEFGTQANGNGTTTWGAAIAVVTHTNTAKKGKINVNISDNCTFDAKKAIYENTDETEKDGTNKLENAINNIKVPMISAATDSKDSTNTVNTDAAPALNKTYIQYNANGNYDQLEVIGVNNKITGMQVQIKEADSEDTGKILKVKEDAQVTFDGNGMTYSNFLGSLPSLDVLATVKVIITDIPLNKTVTTTFLQ